MSPEERACDHQVKYHPFIIGVSILNLCLDLIFNEILVDCGPLFQLLNLSNSSVRLGHIPTENGKVFLERRMNSRWHQKDLLRIISTRVDDNG